MNFPLLLDKTFTYWKSHILGRKYISLLAFREVLTKIFAWSMHSVTQLWLTWKSLIKNKSLHPNQCPSGLSPRIISQVSPFLTKISKNCCTHHVWTVPLSPEPLWETLGMKENPAQHPKMYSFLPSEKSPLTDLNLSLSKVSFLPHQIAIFK